MLLPNLRQESQCHLLPVREQSISLKKDRFPARHSNSHQLILRKPVRRERFRHNLLALRSEKEAFHKQTSNFHVHLVWTWLLLPEWKDILKFYLKVIGQQTARRHVRYLWHHYCLPGVHVHLATDRRPVKSIQ